MLEPLGMYLAQELCLNNEDAVLTHSPVADLYKTLSQIPGSTNQFSVLDLKNDFFSIPLHSESQFLFVIEWKNPISKENEYTWAALS